MKKPSKRPRGRPPVDNPRTARINWRVTPERQERYKRAAKGAKKTLTGWLDDLADEASE